MSACLNQLNFTDVVHRVVSNECNKFVDDYANNNGMHFDFVGELSKQDENQCVKAFKDNFDVDFFITEVLSQDQTFREKLTEYVLSL